MALRRKHSIRKLVNKRNETRAHLLYAKSQQLYWSRNSAALAELSNRQKRKVAYILANINALQSQLDTQESRLAARRRTRSK